MAEQPEVIQHELEETRHALAEKLEQIGEKISGTVETVQESVSNVTETVSNVTEAVEGTVQTVANTVSGTVEAMKDTVEAVGERASETVEAVKQAFNLPDQVRRNPWAWFGGSVVLGFVGGKFLAPRGSRTSEAAAFVRGKGYQATPAEAQGAPADRYATEQGNGTGRAAEAPTTETGPSMLGGFLQQFGSEINTLKGLALGTLFGVARDMISHALPGSLKEQVTDWFNSVTEKAGGKTIQGTVLDEEAEQAKGDEHENEQSDPTEMDRPLGTTERKGKATVGKSH